MTAASKPVIAPGKQLLIRAALDLAVHTRSIRALGVREIGRQAGLNPNTFYRHFSDMDDLGLAILESVVGELRPKLHDLRLRAAQAALTEEAADSGYDTVAAGIAKIRFIIAETVRHFFAFVLENQEAFILGVSELHGASPLLRHSIRKVLENFTSDMAEDIRVLNLLPMLNASAIHDITASFVNRMFFWTANYIESPESRETIRSDANRMMMWLIAGAVLIDGTSGDLSIYRNLLREGPATKV